MRIYLIGFKNCGKTTTGKKLANKLNLQFLDLDDLIEQNDGRTVPEIYSNDGEEIFRNKEKSALHQTIEMDDIVVATGGGAPRFYNNMELMKQNGITVYLRLDEDTLVGRLKVAAQNRPIVKGKTKEQIREYVKDLFTNHEHIYMNAEYVVDSKNLTPDELVAQIIKKYQDS